MNAYSTNNLKTVGIFNDSFPPIMDGVSLTVQNYAYWLNEKKQPVCVVTPRMPDYTDAELYPVYRYTSLPMLGRKPYRLGLPEIDRSLRSTIDSIPFGLVHAHCPFSSGVTALRVAKEQKVPIVATFHSKYREDFEQSVRYKFIAKLMTNRIVRFYEKADEVWIPQASVEEIIREYGFKGKVEVVANGNDFDSNEAVEPIRQQARRDLQIGDHETVFLFVGQIIWEKNIRMIVESLRMINDLPFKMYFVGSGYASDNLKQLVDESGLSDKVTFTGSISDRQKLKQYYAAADLFLFPSTYDTWAIVIHEAAALQTPSLLVNDSTIAKVITNDSDGFLAANNATSVASRLRELILNPDLLKRAGLQASKTINRSWESVSEEVLDRYRHLSKRYHK
jgi:glycosyltransferase involved in cell wall biosynthesis